MANTAPAHSMHGDGADGETRRDFLLESTIAAGAVGTALMVWPLISSMNPAADTLSMSTTEFSTAGIQEGMGITLLWLAYSFPEYLDWARRCQAQLACGDAAHHGDAVGAFFAGACAVEKCIGLSGRNPCRR